MPYFTCPRCRVSYYSAASWAYAPECPSCHERLNRPGECGVSFVATFEDGPKNGPQRRTFMAASVPERMWFAPERRVVDRKTVTHDGWMLVGTAPGGEPVEPWPGQLEFVLDAERSSINPEEDWGTAVYVHVAT